MRAVESNAPYWPYGAPRAVSICPLTQLRSGVSGHETSLVSASTADISSWKKLQTRQPRPLRNSSRKAKCVRQD